jgi:orotidine 5'-phosphate decarboxylase subfamily 2
MRRVDNNPAAFALLLFVVAVLQRLPAISMAESGPQITSFRDKLEARVAAADSLLCVGLDPHIQELFPDLLLLDAADAEAAASVDAGGQNSNDDGASPVFPKAQARRRGPPTEDEMADAAFTFCKTLIDATSGHAACYKPNVAFFEAIGPDQGMNALRRVVAAIPSDIPVILDAKRGDIGSTAAAYATASYDHLGADAVTLSPLMGYDSVSPFVSGTDST